MKTVRLIILIILQLCVSIRALNNTSEVDLLKGFGNFSSINVLKNWTRINETAYTYSIETDDKGPYLKMEKLASSNGAYDDGIYYFLNES
mmetsp:Transcript_40420/g.29785  ORF Transcript_40420/g.29785 Transcript_40420/m.29785 type:complete len:90 (+) Transcript_40420:17-286(+)